MLQGKQKARVVFLARRNCKILSSPICRIFSKNVIFLVERFVEAVISCRAVFTCCL